MKVIVTGGRNYLDENKIFKTLDALNPTHVIQGGATGADSLSLAWAQRTNKICTTVYASWKEHGLSAGPRRNKYMIEEHPEAIILAFPGGKGTANCVETALNMGRVVLKVLP